MNPLKAVTIADVYVSTAGAPLTGIVTARPTVRPLWIENASGTLQPTEHTIPLRATIQPNGTWSLKLPWLSSCYPNSAVQWVITLPDGQAWIGTVPEGQAGPFTLRQLIISWSWGLAVSGISPPPVLGIQGPNVDATTTTIGSVLLRTPKTGTHPVALVTEDLGVAAGIATLDGGAHVPLGQLANLGAAQIADGAITGPKLAAGAVTDAKVTDVAAGKVTGVFGAAQIGAVNPSTLTGTGTVPGTALSTPWSKAQQHAQTPYLDVAQTFTDAQAIHPSSAVNPLVLQGPSGDAKYLLIYKLHAGTLLGAIDQVGRQLKLGGSAPTRGNVLAGLTITMGAGSVDERGFVQVVVGGSNVVLATATDICSLTWGTAWDTAALSFMSWGGGFPPGAILGSRDASSTVSWIQVQGTLLANQTYFIHYLVRG